MVQDGDIIDIDINQYSINLRVSDEELSERRRTWKPVEKPLSGYLKRYAEMVTSADKGAILKGN